MWDSLKATFLQRTTSQCGHDSYTFLIAILEPVPQQSVPASDATQLAAESITCSSSANHLSGCETTLMVVCSALKYRMNHRVLPFAYSSPDVVHLSDNVAVVHWYHPSIDIGKRLTTTAPILETR